MRNWVLALPLLLATGATQAQAPQSNVPANASANAPANAQANAQARCAATARLQVRPGVIIDSAVWQPASPARAGDPQQRTEPTPALPAFCKVSGRIDPHKGADGKDYAIGFELALPAEWNGRFLMQGGGGLNGIVRPATGPTAAGTRPALARGFAVISHDSGHQGTGWDNSFMADQRAALDFAESSVRTVTVAGKALTEQHYGRAIGHSYMTGCSTGGREGMLAIQRYPELFDGVLVGAPAMRTGHSNLAIEWSTVQFNQVSPRDEAGKPLLAQLFTPAVRKTVLDGLLKQCDALDGRADGMVMNVAQCRFRPAELTCRPGQSEGCIPAPLADALDRSFAGPRNAAGYPAYVPVPWDTGVVDTNPGALPGYLPTGGPGPFGPASTALAMDLDARLQALAMDATQRLTDTNVWTDLDTFLGRGGKVLFFHGVSDPWFSAWDSWDWWTRAAKTNGASFTDASRYYMVPGMGHCRGGNAYDTFDLLDPLVAWVEGGKAPERPIASRSTGAASMPMCPHPSYAHYDGGDPARAESYSCRQPT